MMKLAPDHKISKWLSGLLIPNPTPFPLYHTTITFFAKKPQPQRCIAFLHSSNKPSSQVCPVREEVELEIPALGDSSQPDGFVKNCFSNKTTKLSQ